MKFYFLTVLGFLVFPQIYSPPEKQPQDLRNNHKKNVVKILLIGWIFTFQWIKALTYTNLKNYLVRLKKFTWFCQQYTKEIIRL